MANQDNSGTVLKILTGVQAGVDVHLIDGVYTLGSGDDDDIQLIDVSLKPGHARLTLGRGKIEIAGAAGELRTRNGILLEAQGEAQEIEPLDVVNAGTSRFALGPRNGNWASIAEAEDDDMPGAKPVRRRETSKQPDATLSGWRSWQSALPVALVLALVLGGVWFSPLAQANRNQDAEEVARTDLQAIRDAIGQFDFRERIKVEQQLDGVIYVTGFVQSPVERRAVIAATRDVEVPPRVRLQVIETMRSEIANLIAEEKVDVALDLTPAGNATLSGVVLDADKAARVVALVEERVPGLSSLASEIRTAPSLLAEVRELATRSQIGPLVLLRLDGELIEASGVLPTEKIDAWVGFLQAYSTQFAEVISLRSLVQLQNPDGTLVDAPGADGTAPRPEGGLILGAAGKIEGGDVALDVSRLRDGAFELADVFVGIPTAASGAGAANSGAAGEAAAAETAAAAPGETVLQPISNRLNLGALLSDSSGTQSAASSGAGPAGEGSFAAAEGDAAESSGEAGLSTNPEDPASEITTGSTAVGADGNSTAGAIDDGAAQASAGSAASGNATASAIGETDVLAADGRGAGSPASEDDASAAIDVTSNMARRLIERWLAGTLPADEAGRRLNEGMNALQRGDVLSGNPQISFGPITRRYAPLLAEARLSQAADDACWPNARLSEQTVGGTLFWLDLLSVTRDISLSDLDADIQLGILEAALNPEDVAACLARSPRDIRSIYLTEVGRNPDFIAFITRGFEPFTLDIAGADVGSGRYIQTRDGRKMREGSAPDATSRLAIVGELGVALKREDSYATVIYDDRVSWLVR